jgi:hypothetical protein
MRPRGQASYEPWGATLVGIIVGLLVILSLWTFFNMVSAL